MPASCNEKQMDIGHDHPRYHRGDADDDDGDDSVETTGRNSSSSSNESSSTSKSDQPFLKETDTSHRTHSVKCLSNSTPLYIMFISTCTIAIAFFSILAISISSVHLHKSYNLENNYERLSLSISSYRWCSSRYPAHSELPCLQRDLNDSTILFLPVIGGKAAVTPLIYEQQQQQQHRAALWAALGKGESRNFSITENGLYFISAQVTARIHRQGARRVKVSLAVGEHQWLQQHLPAWRKEQEVAELTLSSARASLVTGVRRLSTNRPLSMQLFVDSKELDRLHHRMVVIDTDSRRTYVELQKY